MSFVDGSRRSASPEAWRAAADEARAGKAPNCRRARQAVEHPTRHQLLCQIDRAATDGAYAIAGNAIECTI
ncbi:hypothetical protein ACCUM_2851 [Candidatus Accumulibacter phosphatis]|uniref:Uncharacterized protein n=1 Tax=Candidatus Accumulibacter phosphatis TaxID=327160 RepID=A0A5S4EQ98_9PROT|nr:hypothetical protein ACCUM_2851 [Candidatus Accumulibacter phosphatis]